MSTRNGQSTATVRAKVTWATGSTQGFIYPLVKENDEWRICPE